MNAPTTTGRHRVVVVGGGFAGLQTVRSLARTPVDVTLVDRGNFHLFQPLLYQVAAGGLCAAEIASPLRALLKRQCNAQVLLGEVGGFDLDRRRVLLRGGEAAGVDYDTLRREFRNIDPSSARIFLVEADERLLTAFPPRLSVRAARALKRLGVTPLVDHTVVNVRSDVVALRRADGTIESIPARTVLWAAGVRASGLAQTLARAAGTAVDRAGRVAVRPDLTLPGHPEVFALRDMARVHDADGQFLDLPGVAPVAMQQGRHAAKAIRARLEDREPRPFRYRDKGNVATIGRLKAVADVRGLPLSGTLAWLAWLFVHLFYLVGLQNRVLVSIRWTVSFLTRGRGARLIIHTSTGEQHAS